MENFKKADVLAEALPYLREYKNKIVVVKYGGNAMISEASKKTAMKDVVLLSLVGIKVVLVHGGGPEINDTLKKMNIESKFLNGLRVTDKETADVVLMVLSGKVNKSLVSLLYRYGGNPAGFSGFDGGLICAKQFKKEYGHVGKITKVNTRIITDSLEAGYIPVISTVGYGENGEPLNINADTAAAAIASSLGAESLILMSDIKGIMADLNDENSLIPEIKISEVQKLIENGAVSGGMIPKVQCCVEAIKSGVKKTSIIDGRIGHSILTELLTDEGSGTMFVKE